MPTISPDEILSVESPDQPVEQPDEAAAPVTSAPPDRSLSVPDKVAAAASYYNVPPALALAIAQRESGFDQGKVSPRGNVGIMQLSPGLFTSKAAADAGYGIDNPNDPDQNIDGGMRYLRYLIGKYKDHSITAAAYNAGETAVDRYGGIPPFKETQDYVKAVAKGYTGPPPSAPAFRDQSGSPTLIAQSSQPPGGSVPFSAPVRTIVPPGSEEQAPISYDPTYGDPEYGPDVFAGATVLHKAGLATISAPEDYVSRDGKQKVTAMQVYSPHAAHIGLWTEDGRKLDPSKGWIRTGLGGGGAGGAGGAGGLKPLEHFIARNSKTGQSYVMVMDPMTGAMWQKEGLEGPESQGPLKWMYNRELKQFGFIPEATMVRDPKTGFATNEFGHTLEPAFTPQDVAHERERAADQKEKDYLRLHEKVADMKGMVERGELGAMRTSFGVPVLPGYEKDKAAHFAGIRKFESEHAAEIEKRYQDHETEIQRDWEHREPAAPAAPADTTPKPKKKVRLSGEQLLQQ